MAYVSENINYVNKLISMRSCYPTCAEIVNKYIPIISDKNVDKFIDEIIDTIDLDPLVKKNKFDSLLLMYKKIYKFASRVILVDNKFKVYDLPIDYRIAAKAKLQVILKSYLTNPRSMFFTSFLEDTENDLAKMFDLYYEHVLERGVWPYIGPISFIKDRIRTISDAIDNVCMDEKIHFNIRNVFLSESVGLKDYFKKNFKPRQTRYENYLMYEDLYRHFVDSEDRLTIYMEDIWKSYLTDFNLFKPGEPFAFLMQPIMEEYFDPANLNKVSCKLVTEKNIGSLEGRYGYIYEYDFHTIAATSKEDIRAYQCDESTFTGNLCPVNCQLNDSIGLNRNGVKQYIWYENGCISKLELPNVLVKHQKDKLSAEVILTAGTKALSPIAMYATDDESYNEIMNINNDLPKILVAKSLYEQKDVNRKL